MNNNLIKQLCTFLLIILLDPISNAQTEVSAKNKNPFPSKYTSQIDQKITLKTITLAPVYDNLNGVYADPIQKLLVDLLQNDKSWGYAEFPDFSKKIFIEKFDSEPNEVLDVLSKTSAQGLLTAYITKGPRGITARLKLYTQDEGFLFLEETFEDLQAFEISKIREQFTKMYRNIKNKLPYRGYVLSRRGLDITLSLGAKHGVKLSQELTLAQILKLSRHPKLKELVGVEKEIIAKAKVTQVEDYLSFAQITFEKEPGVVEVGAKVLPTEFISYPLAQLNESGSVIGDTPTESTASETLKKIENMPETPRESYQPDEVAYVSSHGTSQGIFTMQGMFTQYRETTTLAAGGDVNSANSFTPGVSMGLQFYPLQSNLFYTLKAQISNFEGGNSVTGSTPTRLNYTFERYFGALGYDMTLQEIGEAPINLTALIGLTSIKTDVSNSTPTALTSTQTSSVTVQLKASIPVDTFTLGGSLDFHLSPTFSESPVNSGSAKSSITALGFFGIYPINEQFNLRADLSFLNLSANFSGTGTRSNAATSTSIQVLNEQIGIEYLF